MGGGHLEAMTDTTIEIPPDATPDTTFRCAKWACTLAFKHCLRRRAEARKPGPNAKDQTPVPVHPFCAVECGDGRAIAARFGEGEARLIALNGLGAVHPYAPQPPAPPAEEETMPRGRRDEPWPCCGSTRFRHFKDCKEAGKKAAAKVAPAPKPAKAPRVPRGVPVALQVETVEELLARRESLLAELAAVDLRIGDALAAKEAELVKLRAAVKALAGEWETEAARRERDAPERDGSVRVSLETGAAFEREHARRLRALLLPGGDDANPNGKETKR